MKARWLRNRQAPEVIVIFGGWALGPAVFSHLQTTADVLFVEDWRDLEEDLPQLATITNATLVAYSFGVAAAGHWLAAHPFAFRRKIAVSGTLFPVDAARGIPPAQVHATSKALSPATLARFAARAGAEPPSEPDIPALQAELHATEMRGPAPACASAYSFDRIWLGRHDRIFPPANLARAWAGHPVQWLETGHTPFPLWRDWSDLWAEI